MPKTLVKIENPYWEEAAPLVVVPPHLSGYQRIDFQQAQYRHRENFTVKYAWAIPDPASIAFVAQHLGTKAVEIGAGTGYWAWLLSQSGVDIRAFDVAPPDRIVNGYFGPYDTDLGCHVRGLTATFFDVREGGPETLGSHADRSLFLCWPPYADDMAYRCLMHYQGNRVVFIGEPEGGCTADYAFFEDLDKHWELVAEHEIVQWFGLNDFIVVYDRRSE